MILPKKIHITQLIVADIHNHCQHAGVNHVLAQVQNQYWVIDGRQEVKNWEKECKVCERRRVQLSVQIMAPLPRTRVRTTPLQSAVLITLAPSQPRLLKEFAKRYLCLFMCSAARAVHLEMACSLSTTDFLNVFSWMVATRGRPEEVSSDNGTNFFKQWIRNRLQVTLPITESDGIGILCWGHTLVGCLSRWWK